jgi:GT2 family glycosyltransferase
VDRVLGAAFLMRRSLFEAIGGFDERFFLYSEEEDLCLRVNLSGYQVVFNPDAAVIHLGGRSAHPSSTLSIASAAWSRQYFLRKHYSAPGVFFSAVVWTVALSARLVAAAVTFRGAKRIRGYYRAIRSLLSSEYYQNRVRPN